MVHIAAATSPPPAACLNRLERFFRNLTTERLRRGVFTRVTELEAANNDCVAQHDTRPQPSIRIRSARQIRWKVTRADARSSAKQNETRH